MKKKYVLISTIILTSLMVAGGSMAWFLDSKKATNEFNMGTVVVEVEEPDFEEVEGAKTGIVYPKTVQVKSHGSAETYVRVRLIPIWSNPSLPVNNVTLNLADKYRDYWVDNREQDGYFYFKYYLTEGQVTWPLLKSVEFTQLGSEYEGATFTLKVVAEGVQNSNRAWVDVWGLNELPSGIIEEPWESEE